MTPRVPYLDTEDLAHLVRVYRNTGRGGNDLASALSRIAGGVWDRFRFTRDREDFTQETVLHLLQKPLKKADVQKHCFNYFTTCAIRFGLKLRDQEQGDRRRFSTYAAELVEAGRPVVDGIVGRVSACRSAEESLDADAAELLARDLLVALDGIGAELAATRPPRRQRPTPKRARRRRGRS